jgi:hypothetical protein
VFDVSPEARLVQPGDSYKVSVSILRRHPPFKHHTTLARHGEQIAIPRGLRGVGGQGAVGAMGVDELFKGLRGGSLGSREVVGIDHKPTELPQVRPPLAALYSPLVYSGKGWLWSSAALPFTTVEDDPCMAPVLKGLA